MVSNSQWNPEFLEGKFYDSLSLNMVICIGNSPGLMHKLLKILRTLICCRYQHVIFTLN